MRTLGKFASVLVATGLMGLASAAASAGIISFNFNNSGSVSVDGNCGPGCFVLSSEGVATETSGLPGANQWVFEGVMKFFPDWGGNVGSGTGAYGWSFTGGGNDLYGSFTSLTDGLVPLFGDGIVQYTVLGGSGIFNGALGSGLSSISYLLGGFWEEGRMTIVTGNAPPRAVPEPSISTLLVAGLGMVAFMAYRRRRVSTQI